MIILDCEQGSTEWLMARIGIPTASRFDEILTPKTLKYSTSTTKYRNEILAEWSMGYPIQDDMRSGWMQRGTDLEPEARAWYEMERDVEVQKVGFLMREDKEVGGSPDGLVGTDGGVELKVPSLAVHLGYLLSDEQPYVAQVQGYMYLTGRQWWDFCSYHPTLPRVLRRVARDENFIGQLHRHIGRFRHDLTVAKRKLLEMGVRPPEWVRLPDPEQPHEALIEQMYGPEPVDPEPVDAMPSEILRMKQLATLTDDLTADDRLSIQYAAEKRDGNAVRLWTKKLEKMPKTKASA